MNDAIMKFSGVFHLHDTEKDIQYPISVQVLYSDDHHVIVIYRFSEEKLEWIEPVITGVITSFELDPNTTVAMACSCDLLGPDEVEPEDGVSWGIVFSWDGKKAIIDEVRRFEDTKNDYMV